MFRVPENTTTAIRRFLSGERGVATVDWVLLCCGATATAIMALDMGQNSITDYSAGVRNEIQSPYFNTSWTSTLEIPPEEYWPDQDPITPVYETPDGTGPDENILPGNGNNGHGNDDDGCDSSNPGAACDDGTDQDGAPPGQTGTSPDPTPDPTPDPVPPTSTASCPTATTSGTPVSATGQQLWYILTYQNEPAGGTVPIGSCAGLPGNGYISTQPNYSLTVSDMGGYNRLEIETYGNCDTVLLIRDPSGNWIYDDDSGRSTNAEVNVWNNPVLSGTVDIWVGTYGAADCEVTLEIETW